MKEIEVIGAGNIGKTTISSLEEKERGIIIVNEPKKEETLDYKIDYDEEIEKIKQQEFDKYTMESSGQKKFRKGGNNRRKKRRK